MLMVFKCSGLTPKLAEYIINVFCVIDETMNTITYMIDIDFTEKRTSPYLSTQYWQVKIVESVSDVGTDLRLEFGNCAIEVGRYGCTIIARIKSL